MRYPIFVFGQFSFNSIVVWAPVSTLLMIDVGVSKHPSFYFISILFYWRLGRLLSLIYTLLSICNLLTSNPSYLSSIPLHVPWYESKVGHNINPDHTPDRNNNKSVNWTSHLICLIIYLYTLVSSPGRDTHATILITLCQSLWYSWYKHIFHNISLSQTF